MEIYKFKCKDCGARRYEKIDENTYRCEYCGYTEEIIRFSEKPEEETINTDQESFSQFVKEKIENYEETNVHNSAATKAVIEFFITFFFGVWGVHRFLKGKIFTGFVYLFTYGVFGFGYFIDLIKSVINIVNKGRRCI